MAIDPWVSGAPTDLNSYGLPYRQDFMDAWTQYINAHPQAPSSGGSPTMSGTYGGVSLAGTAATNPAIAYYKSLRSQYNQSAQDAATQDKLTAGWTYTTRADGSKHWIAPDGSYKDATMGMAYGPYAGPQDYGDTNFWTATGHPIGGSPAPAPAPTRAPVPAPAPVGGSMPGGPGGPKAPQVPMNTGPPAALATQFMGMPPPAVGAAAPAGVPPWWQAIMANRPSLQQAQAAALRGPV